MNQTYTTQQLKEIFRFKTNNPEPFNELRDIANDTFTTTRVENRQFFEPWEWVDVFVSILLERPDDDEILGEDDFLAYCVAFAEYNSKNEVFVLKEGLPENAPLILSVCTLRTCFGIDIADNFGTQDEEGHLFNILGEPITQREGYEALGTIDPVTFEMGEMVEG